MPLARDRSSRDRTDARAVRTNTHPRANGDVILTPDDILEGAGTFIETDADENPKGLRVGQVDIPDGRHIYVGLTPEECGRQTSDPLSRTPGHLVNYPISEGPPAPDADSPNTAPIPRAEKVRLRVIPAAKDGYPSTTPSSPHWVAFAWVRDGRLGKMGPPVDFQSENGQSFRLMLPTSRPEGIHELAILMAEPGRSRSGSPGKMRVQRVVDFRRYFLPHYDLTGPYRDRGEEAGRTDETRLEKPNAPKIEFEDVAAGCRPGEYEAAIVWTDDAGETMLGEITRRKIRIEQDPRWTVRDEEGELVFAAGAGRVRVERPKAPKGAAGWKLYLYMTPLHSAAGFSAGWRRVMSKRTGRGDSRPWPLSKRHIETAGWDGSEEYYANDDSHICVQDDVPRENTTGLVAPEEAPERPVPYGAARPEPNKYFVRVTDTVDGREGPPSPISSVEIGSDQLFTIVFPDPKNRISNPSYAETDADNQPLHYGNQLNGGYFEKSDQGEVRFGTPSSYANATAAPVHGTDFFDVDPTAADTIELDFSVDSPRSGVAAGQLSLVLRERTAGGVQTDTVIWSRPASAPGDYDDTLTVHEATSASTPRYASTTVEAQILYRIDATGASAKNLQARVRHTSVSAEKHRDRRDRRRKKPPKKRPGRKPGRIQDPPEPPWSPDALEIKRPDRPTSSSAELAALTFEDGALPAAPWVNSTLGAGTISVLAAAALKDAMGIRFRKATSGALAKAATSRAFPVTAPRIGKRHSLGASASYRMTTMPSNGAIALHAIQGTDADNNIAFLQATTASEILSLKIEENPEIAGPTKLTLADVEHTLNVSGVIEVKDLTIQNPTAPGTISATLDSETHNYTVSGTYHAFTITVDQAPRTSGYIKVHINGVTRSIKIVNSNTKGEVATKIQNAGWSGYTITRPSNFTVAFRAQVAGARPATSTSHNGTGAQMNVRTSDSGSLESAASVASGIANTVAWKGWSSAIGPTTNVVRFTANTAGDRSHGAPDSGATGTALAMTTVTEGSVDTREQFAARIRATVFTGWTNAGSGNEVLFTATSAGVRQRSSYRRQATGAAGTIRTLVQGANAGYTVHVRDRLGVTEHKKVFEGLTTASIANVDLQVSGAGTDRAVVMLYGSVGADPLKPLARFEDVDLTGVGVKTAVIGVFEDSAALTWTIDCDSVSITERGKLHPRDHSADGIWLPQLSMTTHRTQPIRQDLFLQDLAAGVVPGAQYTVSAYIRATVLGQTLLRPVVIRALHDEQEQTKRLAPGATESSASPSSATQDATRFPSTARQIGRYTELGDITGEGLTGTTAWAQHSLTVTIPADCHTITLSTRDMGAAEIHLQELVVSPGTTPKRTGLYASSGVYEKVFDLRTPKADPALTFWTRQRIALVGSADVPKTLPDGAPDTTAAIEYRSANADPQSPANPDAASWSPWTQDASLVPQRDFVAVRFTLTGSAGIHTPVVPVGSPSAETVLKLGPNKRMSTLMLADRRELPGGTAFASLSEWSNRRSDARTRLPSGRLHDDPQVHAPVGHLPECELLVFTAEAKRHLEENWKHLHTVEIHGLDVLDVKLSEQPEFKRDTITVREDLTTRTRRAIWRTKLAPSEVTRALPLPPS